MSSLNPGEIRQLREEYGLTCFVETGCYEGRGIQAALQAGFPRVYSCDLSEGMVSRCSARFGDQATIHRSDSLHFIQQLLPEDLGPTLFWLDAHFPGFYGLVESPVNKFPLLDELRCISERSGANRGVIVFDDLRVVCDPDNPRWREGETSEYFTIKGTTLKELIAPFEPTHSCRVDLREEGLVFLTPRANGP